MNLIGVCILLFTIGIVLWLSETMVKHKKWSLVPARKMVHLVAVSAVAISPVFFPNLLLLQAIIAGFVVLLMWAVKANKFAIDGHRRKSWGIALFPFSFLVLLIVFGKQQMHLVVYPMLILAVADAAAAITGEKIAKHFFNLTGDRKSFPGSIVFFIATVSVLLAGAFFLEQVHPVFAGLFPGFGKYDILIFSVMVAMVATLSEALGSGGFDNVTVPLAAAWAFHFLESSGSTLQFALAIILVVLFALLAVARAWLNQGGAATAAMLGIIVFVTGNWHTALPVLLFFISGSLLGKLPRKSITDPKHQQPRDYLQVLCNGGLAALVLVIYSFAPRHEWLVIYLLSVGISTSDTWSSEIGQWAGGRVVDIANFRPMVAGLSGGISWQGTLGGLAGAVLIALTGWMVGLANGREVYWVTMMAFAGMLTDSWMGSRLQASYRLPDGSRTEDAALAAGKTPAKGMSWVTNDLVNLLSNLLITTLAVVLWWLLNC